MKTNTRDYLRYVKARRRHVPALKAWKDAYAPEGAGYQYFGSMERERRARHFARSIVAKNVPTALADSYGAVDPSAPIIRRVISHASLGSSRWRWTITGYGADPFDDEYYEPVAVQLAGRRGHKKGRARYYPGYVSSTVGVLWVNLRDPYDDEHPPRTIQEFDEDESALWAALKEAHRAAKAAAEKECEWQSAYEAGRRAAEEIDRALALESAIATIRDAVSDKSLPGIDVAIESLETEIDIVKERAKALADGGAGAYDPPYLSFYPHDEQMQAAFREGWENADLKDIPPLAEHFPDYALEEERAA